MRSCYTQAVLLGIIFNMNNVVLNLEWSNTLWFMGLFTPVYKVRPVDKQDSGSTSTLHQNMLFPFQSFREEIPIETPNQALIKCRHSHDVLFLLNSCLGTSNIFVGENGADILFEFRW